MNVPLPGVTVDPQGVSTSVAITDSHGNTPTVYSDRFGVNTVALPDTITARTTFFLPGEGPWTITPTASGQVTKATTLTLEDSQVATVTVGSVFDASQWEQFGAYVGASAIASPTASFTATVGEFHNVDATGGAVVVTSPASSVAGNTFWVRKVDTSANTVTFQSFTLKVPGDTWLFWYDGAAWDAIARFPGSAGVWGQYAPPASGDTTGATDNAILQALLNSGLWVELHPGSIYYITGLTLGNFSGILGRARDNTKMQYAGATGGTAIGTAALATNTDPSWRGRLDAFTLVYPFAKLASGSQGVYIRMPYGKIGDIAVDTDTLNNSQSPVTGAYGIVLDGCGNPGPFESSAQVGGQWQHGHYIRCNHVNVIAGESGYVANGYAVDQDSINSAAGPPFNVTIVGAHSYEPTRSHINIIKASRVTVHGGMNESPALNPNILCESTFTSGVVSATGLAAGYAGTARLTHYGVGGVVVDKDPYDDRPIRFTGQVSGAPVVTTDGSKLAPPTVTAGAALGTSPPAITVSGDAFRFKVQFGTGTSPTTGTLLTITYTYPFSAGPGIVMTSIKSGSLGLAPYPSASSGTSVNINCNTAPAASQGGTTYELDFEIYPAF